MDSIFVFLIGVLVGLGAAVGWMTYTTHHRRRHITAKTPIPYPAQETPPVHEASDAGQSDPEKVKLWNSLTRREKQVAPLVARGLTNLEVAKQLAISPRTVDSYLRNVYSKLDVRSRTELANFYRDIHH